MTDLITAAQQALEALEEYQAKGAPFWACDGAVAALRAALAEPVQEPVAWMVYTLDGKSVCVTDNPADFTDKHRVLPLYTSPPRKPLTQESLENLFLGNNSNDWWRLELKEFVNVARAIERAHDIGGEK